MRKMLSFGLGMTVAFSGGLGGSRLFLSDDPRPVASVAGVNESIVFVLLVSPTCSASRDPQLRAAWRTISDGAKAHPSARGRMVSTIGVALSESTSTGLKFLEKFGSFDELIVGHGNFNSGSMRYMLSDFQGPAALPQVVVVRRHFGRRVDGTRYVKSESVVRRVWGVEEIVSAASRGVLAAM